MNARKKTNDKVTKSKSKRASNTDFQKLDHESEILPSTTLYKVFVCVYSKLTNLTLVAITRYNALKDSGSFAAKWKPTVREL